MNRVRTIRAGIVRALAPLLLAPAFGALLLACAGFELGPAATAFLRGSLATRAGLAESAVAATPLLFTGLAVLLSFRAGLFNIGAEGQLLGGMLLATAVATRVDSAAAIPCALLAGLAGGAIVAAFAALLRFARGVPEVLTTLLLNFVVLHLVGLAVHGFLQESARTLPQSDAITAAAELPRFLRGTRLHAGFGIAFLVAAAVAALLFVTRFGLRARGAGASPRAARLAGFPVARDLSIALVLSGALAGLGGAVEICGVTHRLTDDPSRGIGYTAIAVALLGRLHPLGVVGAALFFGVLEAGGAALQRNVGAPLGLVQVLEALLLLVTLLLDSDRLRERLAIRRAVAAGRAS